MKAAVFRQAGQPLSIEDMPTPVPGAHRVLIRVGRCGICGTDLHMTEGHTPVAAPGSVLGHEFAGEVVETGAGVERVKVGDRIAAMPILGCGRCASCLMGDPIRCANFESCFGGYAEYAIAGEQECIKLPDTLSLADGALVEPLAVALHGAAMAGLQPGSRVLVLGAGPIGLGAIYWARRAGASRVDVVELAPNRGALALASGADAWAPPKSDKDDAPSLAPDVVFECVGRPGLLSQAIQAVRSGGTVVSLGFCMAADPIVPAAAAGKEVTLRFPLAWTRREFEIAAEALDSGAVEPRAMVTGAVSLSDMPAAFEALRKDPTHCKLLVDPHAG